MFLLIEQQLKKEAELLKESQRVQEALSIVLRKVGIIQLTVPEHHLREAKQVREEEEDNKSFWLVS